MRVSAGKTGPELRARNFASSPRMRSSPGGLGGHVDRTTVDMERSPVKPFLPLGVAPTVESGGLSWNSKGASP